MKRSSALIALILTVFALTVSASSIYAQDDEEPETRIIAVTKFDVPFHHRSDVFDYMVDYFIPFSQLNPNVINFRWGTHNWGSNAAMVIIMAEYESLAALDADCGQPCDDWDDAHQPPEEETPEREEYDKKLKLFQKYYSHHHDEIIITQMNRAKVEGRIYGEVGSSEDDDDGM